MLLPADEHFIELLKTKHNITLTENDLITLELFYQQQRKQWEFQLANDLNSVYYDIQGGKILAVVALAVVGFFVAPLLGIAGIAGALIGAAIGWRLLGMGNKKEDKKKSDADPKSAQTFGFNSAPSIAPIGGVLPLIFTDVAKNPKGGVRTSGSILNTRVQTWGGVQKFYGLYSLGVGKVNGINVNDLLINKQPLTNFFNDELIVGTQNGTPYQIPFNEFQYYSQCITVSTNNLLGIDKRGSHTGATGGTTVLTVEPDNFEAFSPSDRYTANNKQEFRIVSKNTGNNTLNIDRDIYINNKDLILAIYKFVYETSKACTAIHINMVCQLWARDKDNNLMSHGVLFYVYVDDVKVGCCLIANKAESDIRRQLIIKNLPLTKHKVRMVPLTIADNNVQIFRLGDNQQVTTKFTGIYIGGREVLIEYEQSPNFNQTENDANNLISFINKAQTSTDRGAPCQITTVNEVVYHYDLGHPNVSSYPNQCLGALTATASNRLQSDPSPTWLISNGIAGREHIAAGQAGIGSTNNVLYDVSANFVHDGLNNFVGSIMLRNLETGISLPIQSLLSATQIQTTANIPLFWKPGDRYVVYKENQSLNYFPDIYVWTLTERQGGLGGLLSGTQMYDYFIDFPSIIRSRKFCVANGYFWDGAVTELISWSQWATQESLGSLLYPTRIGGKFGLIPEGQTNPVALFNASNIIADSYIEDYAPRQKLNCVHVVYTDNSTGSPIPRTVSIMTTAASYGADPLQPETIRLDAVTNAYQAIRVGQIYLNSKLMQDLAINFTTGLQGYGLREGDLIIVQHIVTEVEKECSGFVLEADTLTSGFQRVVLSAPAIPGLSNTYSTAIFRLSDSSIQNNLYAEVRDIDGKIWIEIAGLTAPLSPPSENYTGDYVIVGKDIPHKRTFRVQKIEPQENGSVSITAVLWVPEILQTTNLVTVD